MLGDRGRLPDNGDRDLADNSDRFLADNNGRFMADDEELEFDDGEDGELLAGGADDCALDGVNRPQLPRSDIGRAEPNQNRRWNSVFPGNRRVENGCAVTYTRPVNRELLEFSVEDIAENVDYW